MKVNNIFDRLNKKNDIPVSLFPASSMTRTSMRIGRVTPTGYSVNMFQGNKIEVSVSELCRFATLNKPVMNNYEVNFGFFFVPWTAHDEMGTSGWFRKTVLGSSSYSSNYALYMKDYKLNANEFFDPAFDDALKHHPVKVKLKNLGNIKLVGSLYDHLGYYIGTGVDVTNYDKFYSHAHNASNGATGGTNFLIADAVGGVPSYFKWNSATPGTYIGDKLGVCSTNSTASTLTNTDRAVLPFDLWAYLTYWYNIGPGNVDVNGFTFASLQTYLSDATFTTTLNASIGKKVANMLRKECLGIDDATGLVLPEWRNVFGAVLPAQMIDAYNEYLNTIALYAKEGSFELNCLDWLNYMRIYADWFLNDHFTRRDDFLDMIGEAYYRACGKISANADWNVTKLFTPTTALNPANIGNYKCNVNPELQFFADYIRRGECLPVLWELSRMTAQRCEVDITGVGGLTDTPSTLSAGDTAVGSTIREHFFNRAVQRFKDLVSRAGYDFRNNTRVLYGAGVDDAILNRSQLIAIKKFAVNVGDVQQTSESSKSSNLGDFAGFAYSKNGTDRVSWEAKQNGTFMVLTWIRPRNVAYATGVDREKMKDDYMDYLIPSFGGVGYQDVCANEVFASASNSPYKRGQSFTSLGKEEIYSEYMSVPNHVSGNMRTYNKHWNSDRFLYANPEIDKSKTPKFLYITDDDDINRVFSNYVDDPVLLTAYFDGDITRQLPNRIRTDF